jgi:hypothetical protein
MPRKDTRGVQPRRRRGGTKVPSRHIPDPPSRILVATPALALGDEVFARVRELAAPDATVLVLAVAKVFGTSLGIPHPGLQPTKREWEDLRAIADGAAARFRAEGFETKVALSRSRNAPKMIARWAEARRIHAIIVPDPERPRVRRMIEGDVAKEIGRKTVAPVHAVSVPSSKALHGAARAS